GRRHLYRQSRPQAALPLAELEALSRTLLSILLTLFAARITGDHTLSLQLLSQLRILLHQRARQTQLYGISLSSDTATLRSHYDVERGRRLGRGQRSLRSRTLCRSHEVFFKRAPVDLE